MNQYECSVQGRVYRIIAGLIIGFPVGFIPVFVFVYTNIKFRVELQEALNDLTAACISTNLRPPQSPLPYTPSPTGLRLSRRPPRPESRYVQIIKIFSLDICL